MFASRHPGSQRPSSISGRGSIRSTFALGLGVLGLFLACSQSDPAATPETQTPDFCAATYGARCDLACSDDAACGLGLFCAFGKCTAECTTASGCGVGLTCSSVGRCVGAAPPMMTTTPLPPAPPPPPPPVMTCPQDIKVSFTRETPDVVFVIDQSASMRCPMNSEVACNQAPDPPPNPPQLTRWDALRNALLEPTGPIAELQDQVNFGLLLYSAESASGEDVCPDFAQVPVAPNNYETIKTKYLVEQTKEATPTGEALQQAIELLSVPPAPGAKANPKYVILATDGNPNNCFVLGVPSPTVAAEIRKDVEDTARAGFTEKGVTTLVIAVGKGLIDPAHLQSLALAGGEGKPAVTQAPAPGTEKYYEVGNEAELIATFDELTKGVRSCVIELDATVDAADAAKGKITLDGQPVAYDDPNGWRLGAGNDKIEFLGESCTKVRAASTEIAVAFACGSKVTPKPPR
jgi:von Willebrand factor type A domain-containing protein